MSREDAEAKLGAKLGGRLANYIADTMAASRERLAGQGVKIGMELQHQFFELTGSEVRRTVSPLCHMIGSHPDAPAWVKDTGLFVAKGKGQWATLLAGTATGAALGGGVMDLIANELNPITTALIGANPNLQLSPAEAAGAAVRGLGTINDWYWEAARSGIDRERFLVLKELNTTVLAPGEIVELFQRGVITQRTALEYLHRTGFDGHMAKELLRLSEMHISMAEAGQMWNRSIVTTDELVTIGAINGYSEDDALKYAELGGEPPSPEFLYTAFRRGFIDADRLRRGIVQGPIRTEWFDLLEKMQYRSMTPEQAGSAVTQGHMTITRGRAIAQEYGLNPEDFEIIVETSGRPPGIEFAGEALLRGFITEDQFRAMFLESAIKNRYIDVIRQMVTRLVPQETARSLLAKGVATVEWTTSTLLQHGFSPEDAEMLIAAATVEKTQATRDLSLSAVRELYAEQEIDEATALDMLFDLGYDQQEAEWELILADLARVRTHRNAVITKVKAAYVKGFMDEETAVTTLDSLHVPPARRMTLLELWDIERTTVTRDLTPAQLVAAAKKSLMAPSVAHQRLMGQGYEDDDARVLLALSGVGI